MNLRNIRIGYRLGLGFGLVIALLTMVAGLSVFRIHMLSEQVTHLLEKDHPRSVLAHRIKADTNEVSRSMLSILIMTDAGQIEEELQKIEKSYRSSEQWMTQLQQSITDEQGRQLMAELSKTKQKVSKSQQSFVQLIKNDQKEDALTKFLFSIRPAHSKYFQRLDELVQLQEQHMINAGMASVRQAQRTEWLILLLSVAALAASAVVAYFATLSITRPLNRAVRVAKQVAKGDLTGLIQTSHTDETGQLMHALNEMNVSLQHLVGQVRQSTEAIASASVQIASGNSDLSERTEQQSASLQQTSGTMNELTAMVRQNAEHAAQANQLVASASEVAAQGGEVVAQVVQTMGTIDASSRKIVDIISVIDGIAFQTNLLALNAAVEAARAGEQGRGFAVVAGEVRTLAQRAATASKEIKDLIHESVDKVQQGSRLVNQAGSTMGNVVARVHQVSDIIAEISTSSHSQRHGIEAINQAIQEMDDVTQRNAALVEQAAAAAESMQNQAQSLAKVVSVFRLDTSATIVPEPGSISLEQESNS